MTQATMNDLHPTFREWCYAREVMRRLGFSADDLFCTANTSGKLEDRDTGEVTSFDGSIIAVLLRTQGKEFVWTIGPVPLRTVDEIEIEFERAKSVWNALPQSDELDAAFFASEAFSLYPGLVRALHAKGFQLGRTRLN